LQLRKREAELFARGDYLPLEADECAVAFARVLEDRQVVCVVPRLTLRLVSQGRAFATGGTWGDRVVRGLTRGRYRDELTGRSIDANGELALAEAFTVLPVALLSKEDT